MAGLLWAGSGFASSSDDETFFDDDGSDWLWSVEAASEIEKSRTGSSGRFEGVFPDSLYCKLVVPQQEPEEKVVAAHLTPSSVVKPPKGILKIQTESTKPIKKVSFDETVQKINIAPLYNETDFYTKEDERRNRLLIELGAFSDDEDSEDENGELDMPVLGGTPTSYTWDWQAEKRPVIVASPQPKKPAVPFLRIPQARKTKTVKEETWVGPTFKDLSAGRSKPRAPLATITEEEGEF